MLAAPEPDGRGEVAACTRCASLDDVEDPIALNAPSVDLIGDRARRETGLRAVADDVPDNVDHSGRRERSLRGRHEPTSGADDDRSDLAERVTLVEVVADDVDVLHASQVVPHSDEDASATCAANHVPFEERVGVASHLYPEHLRKRRWLVRDRAVHKALAYDQPRALPRRVRVVQHPDQDADTEGRIHRGNGRPFDGQIDGPDTVNALRGAGTHREAADDYRISRRDLNRIRRARRWRHDRRPALTTDAFQRECLVDDEPFVIGPGH